MNKYYWLKFVETRVHWKNNRNYTESEDHEVQILIDKSPLSWLVSYNEAGKEIRTENNSVSRVDEEVSYKGRLIDWKEISEEDYNLFENKTLTRKYIR